MSDPKRKTESANDCNTHWARWGCSNGLLTMWLRHGTLLGAAYALATSGVAFPFVLKRLSNPPGSGTPSRGTATHARFEPCESKRWGDAHSRCPRCLVAMRLWHGTLLGAAYALATSGVAFPFVLKRLSNPPGSGTPSRGTATHARFEPCESKRWGGANSRCPNCFVAMRLWHGTLLGAAYAIPTSDVAFPFVLESLSNIHAFTRHRQLVGTIDPTSRALQERCRTLTPRSPSAAVSLRAPMPTGDRPTSRTSAVLAA